MRTVLFVLIVLALGAASFFYWGYSKKPLLETVQVTQGKAVEAVYATAVVEPVNWSAVAPLKTERILNILVEEGQDVQVGDILARVDDSNLREQYEEYKALEEFQITELERAQKLIKTGAISQQNHDERASDLSQTIAARKRVEEEIRQMSLTAPQDGVVLWRNVEPGEIKQAGETVFWIGQPKPLRLNAEVDEEDIPKIKVGQKVLILADAFPDDVMEAQVSQITPKGDPVNKSYRVYMSLPDETKLMIGMTVESNTVIHEKDNALLVPASSVLDGFVFRVTQNQTLEKMSVQTGTLGSEQTEILNGLSIGDEIILNPTPNLQDGQRIRVQ